LDAGHALLLYHQCDRQTGPKMPDSQKHLRYHDAIHSFHTPTAGPPSP